MRRRRDQEPNIDPEFMRVERWPEVRPLLKMSNFSHVKIRQSVQTESWDGSREGGGAQGVRTRVHLSPAHKDLLCQDWLTLKLLI